ncbi:flagellar hook-associated family protein [Agrobacterium sp. ES01]|uniref:flagellar hook-associated family protein n=1 Tax=Agrobacterium sp. ES01 TaxID=3420714 RepID=UPI003D0F7F11
MKTSNISNLSVQNAMRLTILQAQNELIDTQKEVTTGQYADIGAELGSRTTLSLDLSRESTRLLSLIDTNGIATQRLESSQAAMEQMSVSNQTIKEQLTLLQGSGDETTTNAAMQEIGNALATFTNAANTAVVGEYLFAGINTDVRPLVDYQDTTTGLQASFDTAFQTYFGFTQTDPATATIAATGPSPSMDDFLTTVVEPMFDEPSWSTNWSNATDETMKTRISQTEVVQTSATLNSDGMKKFMMSAVVALELAPMNLSDETRGVVIDTVTGYNNVALSGIDAERTQLGLSQERVKDASASLEIQQDIMENSFNSMVEVDVYEASTKVNNLLSLVETSYTLTSKIQQLSLVNFL